MAFGVIDVNVNAAANTCPDDPRETPTKRSARMWGHLPELQAIGVRGSRRPV
jgi:hypothetical protein